MHAFGDKNIAQCGNGPSEQLSIAVTFKGAGRIGPTKFAAHLSTASVGSFAPVPGEIDLAVEVLKQRGFVVSGRGKMTLSVRGTPKLFEQTFGTQLTEIPLSSELGYAKPSILYPMAGAPWQPDADLAELIDDAYIQWPHIYMGGTTRKKTAKRASAEQLDAPAKPRPTPPSRNAPCLSVLGDVPRLLNAARVHQQGGSGSGIRVAMIDTGFAHNHPFFVENRFRSSVVLAPGASFRDTDPRSHGTGESANVFALAPQVSFIGIKLEDDRDPAGGATILEGFQEALRHDPHVISVSMGHDLRAPDGRSPLSSLPNGLKALEVEIQAAVASGIVVVFSAGNGHYSFPGQMPEVIAAGGAYFNADERMVASDYASAFVSKIYSGRSVPDVCGLVGPLPHADYIMLPVPADSALDRSCAQFDGTQPDDGWAVFSGTSAAAPQIAGICALLRGKNPDLSPAAIKALLQRTARDVRSGHANPASDPAGVGLPAGPSLDGATGHGLVDTFAAWNDA